ncbi:phosphoglycerate dehydrogenase [Paucisalibacillus sp. EB02]|uniref:phosphoglycerate dehydrogenase n=1 Tax=Paucisalibacillus sp. EB02 TaxID=1347087 RepID=UPI0004BAD774|nr:phosphoglycerate dehydrogenase [Paucisalibacillus sp. EB02]
MKKILITPRSYGMFNRDILNNLEKEGFEVVREVGPLSEERMISLIQDVDALIVGTDELTEKIIDQAQNLKVISKYGTGIDNIPKEYAEKRGVIVTNTPSVNNEAVADYTFGLMLSVARNIAASAQNVKEGKWSKHVGVEVFGKTLGIIGFGAIGRSVAERAKGFKMNILVYDVFQNQDIAEQYDITYAELEEVVSRSDFIAVHVPLISETRNLLDYSLMSKMKEEAIIVNTARGGIINEDDLYRILKEGKIRGAGLDVFSVEPPTNSPLLELENAVLTPHNAASSKEAIQRMTLDSTKNVLDYFNSVKSDVRS